MTTATMRVRTEQRRGFQPPWYTVRIMTCPFCAASHTLRVTWHGPAPVGAIRCDCGAALGIGDRTASRE